MSSQKGNTKRVRSQKHQNSFSFKNNLHDKTKQTTFINTIQISDVCERCKAILEWKIKYKKYKLLKNPSTCVKCNERNVTLSYRTMCEKCALSNGVCPKCGKQGSECRLNAPVEIDICDDDEPSG